MTLALVVYLLPVLHAIVFGMVDEEESPSMLQTIFWPLIMIMDIVIDIYDILSEKLSNKNE